MWNFILIYGGTIIISLFWAVSWLSLSAAMLYKKLPHKSALGFCLYFTAIQLIYNYLTMQSEFLQLLLVNHTSEFILFSTHTLVLTVFLYQKPLQALLKCASAAALAYFCIYNFFSGIQIIFLDPLEKAKYSDSLLTWILALFALYFAQLTASLLLSFFVRRLHFRRYFSSLFDGRKKYFTFVFCILVMHSYRIILFINPQWNTEVSYSVVSFSLIIIVILLLLYLAIHETNKKQLAVQEAQLRQQDVYLQLLESIQRDVRAFRHDYQNMIAGLYLQAEQGDTAGVQAQLRSKLQYFDDNLAGAIRQTTYLSNIQAPEVKSLLAVKLTQFKKTGITYEMEVVHPVTTFSMETEDLLRVLGILLDNAAEAAQNAEEKFIGLILLAEPDFVHIVISNTYSLTAPPTIGEIWKDGYSSKGIGRGTGLASCRQILNKYPDIISRTSIQKDLFRQEIIMKL